jgi:hypothetical protein
MAGCTRTTASPSRRGRGWRCGRRRREGRGGRDGRRCVGVAGAMRPPQPGCGRPVCAPPRERPSRWALAAVAAAQSSAASWHQSQGSRQPLGPCAAAGVALHTSPRCGPPTRPPAPTAPAPLAPGARRSGALPHSRRIPDHGAARVARVCARPPHGPAPRDTHHRRHRPGQPAGVGRWDARRRGRPHGSRSRGGRGMALEARGQAWRRQRQRAYSLACTPHKGLPRGIAPPTP